MTTYSLIVAHSLNHHISRGGRIPWRVPEDLRWFRLHTVGKVCIVGSLTYRQLPPLPHRELIVLSTQPVSEPPGVQWARNLPEALGKASRRTYDHGAHSEVMVIGGARVYDLFLRATPLVRRIYRTTVGVVVEGGDRNFGPLDDTWETLYQKKSRSARNICGAQTGFEARFEILQRQYGRGLS